MIKNKIIYPVLLFLFSTSISVYTLIFISWYYIGIKFALLSSVRIILLFICINSDAIIQIVKNDQMTTAMEYIRAFDITAQYKENNIYFNKNNLQITITIIVILGWIVIGYLSFTIAKKNPAAYVIIYCTYGPIMSMQILKFCGIIIMIHQRFNHLRGMIMPESMS